MIRKFENRQCAGSWMGSGGIKLAEFPVSGVNRFTLRLGLRRSEFALMILLLRDPASGHPICTGSQLQADPDVSGIGVKFLILRC
jgi:hypothetical protein